MSTTPISTTATPSALSPVPSMQAKRTMLLAAIQWLALLGAARSARAEPVPAVPPPTPDEAFDRAAREFRARRHAAAFGRFAQLADRGHEDAASVALLMLRHGPALFDSQWYATPAQRSQWSALAVRAARRPMQLVLDEM